MVRTRFALLLYFCMDAHKAAYHTLSNKVSEDMVHGTVSADVGDTFHTGF